MGMGSLARYRKWVMITGFVLFAGGAIVRWHSKRQLHAVQRTSPTQPMAPASWQDDCETYACRLLDAPGSACQSVCAEAVESGLPRVPAERIAQSCRKHCLSIEGDTLCMRECFLDEAAKMSASSR